MGELILRAFRVRNFRNIDDSGWIPVDRVTALVGRNEAGKTTLLKALYRLNPASPEAFDPQSEFPRERYVREFREPGEWPVASARFEIAPSLREALAPLTLPQHPPEFVVATRYYDQRLALEFEAAAPAPASPLAAVLAALDQLEQALPATPDVLRKNAVPEGMKRADGRPEDAAVWISAVRQALAAEPDLGTTPARNLLARLLEDSNRFASPESAAALAALAAAVAAALDPAAPAPLPDQDALRRAVEPKLPVFIYVGRDAVLDSALYLPRVAEALAQRPADPALQAVGGLFSHGGLSAQELLDLGVCESRERRQRGEVPPPEVIRRDEARAALRAIKLSSASADITRRFGAWWKQAPVAIRYHADGDFFRIWIADAGTPAVEIELESRSQGFQWFFSFYLQFLSQSEGERRDSVLLLDCPGTHLHPAGQQELLGLFDRLAEAAPLIYATHSPFLVDGDHLDRLRMVGRGALRPDRAGGLNADGSGGFRVASGTWPADRDTLYPVRAAAGYALMKRLMSGRRHLLIGELSDFFYLQSLNLLCRKSRRQALAESIQLTPCGGAALAAGFAALFRGDGERPLLLLSGEGAAMVTEQPLLQELQGAAGGIVLMDGLLGQPETGIGIEDLIGEIAILGALDKLLGQHLLLMPADRVPGGLAAQVAAAAKRLGVGLPGEWKSEIARLMAAEWSLKEPDALPATLLDAAGSLFAEINLRLGEGPAETSGAAPGGAAFGGTAAGPLAIRLANSGAQAEAGGAARRFDPKIAARIALAQAKD